MEHLKYIKPLLSYLIGVFTFSLIVLIELTRKASWNYAFLKY